MAPFRPAPCSARELIGSHPLAPVGARENDSLVFNHSVNLDNGDPKFPPPGGFIHKERFAFRRLTLSILLTGVVRFFLRNAERGVEHQHVRGLTRLERLGVGILKFMEVAQGLPGGGGGENASFYRTPRRRRSSGSKGGGGFRPRKRGQSGRRRRSWNGSKAGLDGKGARRHGQGWKMGQRVWHVDIEVLYQG